ncbi:MAG: hypothetical protein IPH35_18975 [Rhodoferax sp.]|nr:hypothetical protein [Rhodoferax sp.]
MHRSSPMESVRNDFVTCIIDHAENAMRCAGVEPKKAKSIAIGIADKLVEVFGGQNITFPKEHKRKQAQKEAMIFSQFTGTNYRALAVTHNMTERGLRKLLIRVRSRIARDSKTESKQ